MNAIKKLLHTPDLTYQIGSVTGDVVDTWPVTIQTTAGELRAARAEAENLNRVLEEVLPVLDFAMDISHKYEPCGYYCDEAVGHVDHKLFNLAKYTKGKLVDALKELE